MRWVLAVIMSFWAAEAHGEDPPTLIATWSVGSYPSGIAVDAQGTIYACHFGAGKVMVFTPDGTLQSEFGSSGSGNGQFVNPEGIAVDATGNIYVTDFNLGRVQKFSNGGSWLQTWSFALDRPQGIAVDAAGFVYVADSYFVRKFTSDGQLVLSWGGQGSASGQFNAAQGVAIDSQGNVHVADSVNLTVQEFTPAGEHVGTLAVSASRIQGIAFDPMDNLYVCDFPGYQVTKFSSGGATLSSWTAVRPIFVAADAFGNVYVTSSVGASITKYSYVQTPEPPQPPAPAAIRITCDNGYLLFVNGELVGANDAWRDVETYNVDLVPGENVVAVYGYDSCCNSGIGLIAEIYAPGGAVYVTDASWKASPSGPGGWNQLDFDDSEWTSALDQGPFNSIPWTLFRSPFTELAAPSSEQALRSGQRTARQVVPVRVARRGTSREVAQFPGQGS